MPYPYLYSAARDALRAAGVQRCWSLPYAHRAGMSSALNRWMAETFSDDSMVVPGATVHPEDDVPRVLDEALGELRLPVVKLHCSVGNFSADDPRLEPLWERVSARGQPVVVHAGKAVDGATTERDLEPIARLAERWPDARIVIAHFGFPAWDRALAILRSTRSVCADLTPAVTYLLPVKGEQLAGLEHRILFGSDVPNTAVSVEQGIAHARALGVDADAVLGGNAQRLLESVAR